MNLRCNMGLWLKKEKKMISSFDIETYDHNDKLIPYCVSFYSRDISKVFFGINCIEEFQNFIFDLCEKKKKNKKQSKLIIFSHNLTFDGSLLIQNINTNKKL